MNTLFEAVHHFEVAVLLGRRMAVAPPWRRRSAIIRGLHKSIEEPSPLLLHSSSQGYLGVLVGDVDNDSAPKLKLKEVRGAVDHADRSRCSRGASRAPRERCGAAN